MNLTDFRFKKRPKAANVWLSVNQNPASKHLQEWGGLILIRGKHLPNKAGLAGK